ncbi:NAD(P)H-binding protein [Deinococcus sp. Arct2-2]|uniref:NAD(P)H-binding protein n=1 Tax=Deinococcus sp. Arct2-2 TaxID=2568653 RepID=UPI001454E2A3|nr:NAD(P)H-binding protein [Deinococcus sp. Arct2-2]
MIVVTPTGPLGRPIIDLLLARSALLRALVPDPEHIDPKTAQRAEVIQGSPDDLDALKTALQGADSVFWLPSAASQADADAAQAARRAFGSQGVQRVVTVNHGTGSPSGMDDLNGDMNVHARCLCVPLVVAELLEQIESLTVQGLFRLPQAADHLLPILAAVDVNRVAVDLLLDTGWTGRQSVLLVGVDALTPDHMSEVLERPVHFEPISAGERRETTLPQDGADAEVQGHGVARSPALLTRFREWCEAILRLASLVHCAEEVRWGTVQMGAADPVLASMIDMRPNYEVDAWRRERSPTSPPPGDRTAAWASTCCSRRWNWMVNLTSSALATGLRSRP